MLLFARMLIGLAIGGLGYRHRLHRRVGAKNRRGPRTAIPDGDSAVDADERAGDQNDQHRFRSLAFRRDQCLSGGTTAFRPLFTCRAAPVT